MTTDQQNQDRVRQFYNRQVNEHPECPAILGSSTKLHADYRNLGEWQNFIRLVELERSFRILELGCGGGRWVARLAPMVAEAVGVDISEKAIEHARQTVHRLGLANARFETSSIVDHEPDGAFDLVYFSGVLLYLNDDDAQRCLGNLQGHLARGAVIVVRDSLTERPYQRTTPDYKAYYRGEPELSAMLSRIGYRLRARRRATPPAFSPRLINSRHTDRLYRAMCAVGIGGLMPLGLRWISGMSQRNLFPDHLDGIRYSHDFLVYEADGSA